MVYDQDRTLPRAAGAFIELIRNGVAANNPSPSLSVILSEAKDLWVAEAQAECINSLREE